MLVAINKENNEKLYAYKDDSIFLKKLSKDNLILCPECGASLSFNQGKVKISYFSHRKNADCSYPYWETESAEHMRGKLELKERLESLYPNSVVELEYKVKETNQRSDVMVIHPNGEKWAFEVQLSKISIATFIERSELYAKAGVYDFWLVGYDLGSINWSSTKEKYGERVDEFSRKNFRLYIDESEITVNNTCKYDMRKISIDKIMVKKRESSYTFRNKDDYKSSYNEYQKVKLMLKKHFQSIYPKTKVHTDYKLSEYEEKIDVLIESRKGKIGFKLLYPYFSYNNIEDKIQKLNKIDIPIIWMRGIYDSKIFLLNENVLSNMNVYDIIKDKSDYYICEYISGKVYEHFIKLNLVKLKRDGNNGKYKLVDAQMENKIKSKQYKITFKKIHWSKFTGKWVGIVYGCPIKEAYSATVSSIDECKKCSNFGGIKVGNKELACRDFY